MGLCQGHFLGFQKPILEQKNTRNGLNQVFFFVTFNEVEGAF